MQRKLSSALLLPEISFTTSRSSGPGGQNVNKVNSKVSLRLDVDRSGVLTEDEKQVIREKLKSFITKDGELIIHAQDSRSQFDNKEAVLKKLDSLLTKAFTKKKARKATKPSKSAVQERIKKKKALSEKKQWRRKDF